MLTKPTRLRTQRWRSILTWFEGWRVISKDFCKKYTRADNEHVDMLAKLVAQGDDDITPIQPMHRPTTRARAQKLNV
jgi:hypothetical protein